MKDMGIVAERISFFVNAGIRFVDEMCKMRAFVRLWDEITRERYGVNDEKQRRLRYGVQVNSLGLTEQQPENNIMRIILEMLAVRQQGRRARAVQCQVERGVGLRVRGQQGAARPSRSGLRERPPKTATSSMADMWSRSASAAG